MKKIMWVVSIITVAIMVVLLCDILFMGVNVTFQEISVSEEAYLNSDTVYKIFNNYSMEDTKTVYFTIEVTNKSFIKTYKYLELQHQNNDDAYPFVSEAFDMGGESGIKILRPRQVRTQYHVTALVDKSIPDSDIIKLLSKKKVTLKGLFLGNTQIITDNIPVMLDEQ